MNNRILKFVFFLVVENNTLGITKIKNCNSPNWTIEELYNKLIHPFLNGKKKVHPMPPALIEFFLAFQVSFRVQAISVCQRANLTFYYYIIMK